MFRKIKHLLRDMKYWFQRRTRGWSDDETWCLDYNFYKWLNSRLKIFIRDANKVVNLDYYVFELEGENYTLLELMYYLVDLTDNILELYDSTEISTIAFYNEYPKLKGEIFKVFPLIIDNLGW